MTPTFSRRDLFATLLRPLQPRKEEPGAAPDDAGAKVAVIQGRRCLALQSFCTVCAERCPVPGAIRAERGMPMVVRDICTGCGICREVCPAPENAILLLHRPAHATRR